MKVIFLALCLGFCAAYPADYSDEVDSALSQIRNFLNTDEGVSVARNFVRRFDDGHAILFLVKEFVTFSSSDTLKELLNELLKDIPELDDGQSTDVHKAFLTLHHYLLTDDGLRETRDYFQDLKTDHPIASRVRSLIVEASEADLRNVIEAILPPVFYAEGDVKAELRSLFHEIRAILITDEGIKAVRDFARAVQPTHPALFLIKGFIISADDKSLLEILEEIFKDFDYVQYESASEKLERLFLKVRDLLKTDEGFSAIKSFLMNINSDHPIVSRVHAFISQASDETLRDILDALFGDI